MTTQNLLFIDETHEGTGKTVDVKITDPDGHSHIIAVDVCIAKEVDVLNNKHHILTRKSCCNHRKGGYGTIAVVPGYETDMESLGYRRDKAEYGYGITQIRFSQGQREEQARTEWLPTYKAKIKCSGACKNTNGRHKDSNGVAKKTN